MSLIIILKLQHKYCFTYLFTPLVYYDKAHIYTPISHQDKMLKLEETFSTLSDKCGYEIVEIKTPDII